MAKSSNADNYANERIGIFFPGFPAPLTGQCTSLIKWYLGEMCGFSNWQSARGHAKDFGDTLVKQGLARVVPANERRRGDIVVWKRDGGGYGHIGVLCSSDNVFEENAGIAGTASKNVPDDDGGFTKVYASRLDPLDASWRVGSPTFYRVNSYSETVTPPAPQVSQSTQGGEDMIDQATLTKLFNAFLNRNPDAGAVSHYVGNYTTSFVVADLLASSEHQRVTTAKQNELINLQTQVGQLTVQLTNARADEDAMTHQRDDLTTKLAQTQTTLNAANDTITRLQLAADKPEPTKPTGTVAPTTTQTPRDAIKQTIFETVIAWLVSQFKKEN